MRKRARGWLLWGGPGPGTHPARSGGAWRPPARAPGRGSRRPARGAGSAAGRRRAVRPPLPRSRTPPRPRPAGTRTPLGRGDTRDVGARPAPVPPRPAPPPGLTVHRLWPRVAVGEPGPHAEAGSVGAGPHPGVREGQRRPAGGAVQAGHGALGGELEEGRAGGPGQPTAARGQDLQGARGWSRLRPGRQVARKGRHSLPAGYLGSRAERRAAEG